MKQFWFMILGGAVAACLAGIVVTWGRENDRRGPPRFQLGKVLPPFVRDELDLTAEQEAQLSELEKEVRQKLEKIFTEKQREQIEKASRRGPDGPPPPPKGKGRAFPSKEKDSKKEAEQTGDGIA